MNKTIDGTTQIRLMISHLIDEFNDMKESLDSLHEKFDKTTVKKVENKVSRRKDLTDRVFGNLTVIEQGIDHVYPNGQKRSTWVCKCKCGTTKRILTTNLTSGRSRSCGCSVAPDLENFFK